MLNIEYIIIIILSVIIIITTTLLIVFKSRINHYKHNQDFDYATKKFIMDDLSKLYNQNQELYSGIRLILNKIDDIELVKKIENLNLKVNKISKKVNADYQEKVIEDDFNKKQEEKLKKEKENHLILEEDENYV